MFTTKFFSSHKMDEMDAIEQVTIGMNEYVQSDVEVVQMPSVDITVEKVLFTIFVFIYMLSNLPRPGTIKPGSQTRKTVR